MIYIPKVKQKNRIYICIFMTVKRRKETKRKQHIIIKIFFIKYRAFRLSYCDFSNIHWYHEKVISFWFQLTFVAKSKKLKLIIETSHKTHNTVKVFFSSRNSRFIRYKNLINEKKEFKHWLLLEVIVERIRFFISSDFVHA